MTVGDLGSHTHRVGRMTPKVHDSHHTDDRLTACGRKWTALSSEAQSGPVTCRSCQRNLKSFWNTRN